MSNPRNFNLHMAERELDLWTVAAAEDGISLELETPEARDRLAFRLHMTRAAVEAQQRNGQPWNRHVTLEKVDERGLRFTHKNKPGAGAALRIRFRDGTTCSLEEAVERVLG